MIEDKATEKLKKRAQKLGLIVNAGADKSGSKPKAENKKKGDKKTAGSNGIQRNERYPSPSERP